MFFHNAEISLEMSEDALNCCHIIFYDFRKNSIVMTTVNITQDMHTNNVYSEITSKDGL